MTDDREWEISHEVDEDGYTVIGVVGPRTEHWEGVVPRKRLEELKAERDRMWRALIEIAATTGGARDDIFDLAVDAMPKLGTLDDLPFEVPPTS